MRNVGILSGLCVLLTGCPSPGRAVERAPSGSYGLTEREAIEVCQPQGARSYLAALECPSGQRPQFTRMGSVGARTPIPGNLNQAEVVKMIEDSLKRKSLEPGQPDRHIVDGYEVRCGSQVTTVYLDTYHCDTAPPRQAPAGFRFSF